MAVPEVVPAGVLTANFGVCADVWKRRLRPEAFESKEFQDPGPGALGRRSVDRWVIATATSSSAVRMMSP